MNFCLCGAQAGYPHHPTCPYPLFRCTEQQEDEWLAKRAALTFASIALAAIAHAAAAETTKTPNPQ